jgi:hypothetical protein
MTACTYSVASNPSDFPSSGIFSFRSQFVASLSFPASLPANFEAKEGSMKDRSIAIAAVCVVLASALSAQQGPMAHDDNGAVHGSGTINFIPKFTSPRSIGNSNIFQSPAGNVGIGTTAPLFPVHIFSNNTFPPAGQDTPITLYVETSASVNSVCPSCLIVGLEGLASADTGTSVGAIGVTFSDEGIGVLGNRPNPVASGTGGGGVRGLTSAGNFDFTYGTAGVATAATGSSVGVFGQSWSPDGTAGFFANAAGGNILVGGIGQPASWVFRVDGTGRVYADGGFQPGGADFAESMAATGDRSKYAAGDLLVIDPGASRHVALAEQPYSTLVAGIYSTRPGMLGTTRKMDESAPGNEVPLAVVGIVPCKVTAENGPIQTGDLLVTSSTPGHAMKGTDRSRMLGAVVGKALEPMPKGTGVIQVLVTLQ